MPARKNYMMFCVILTVMSVWFTGCSKNVSDARGILLEEQTDGLEKDHREEGEGSGSGQSEVKAEPEHPEISSVDGDEVQPSGTSCTVYVCGAVNAPGVYELPAGSRIYEALNAAGGACAEADPVYLNRAEEIQDGQQIYVPTVEEAKALGQPPAAQASAGSGEEAGGTGGKVNLNTASKEELMTLTGIGETKAQSILAYRMEHGRFTSVEELMQIPGIKEGVFRKIRDSITVA